MKEVKVKLDIVKTVEPVAQRHRRVPFHLREKLEKELDRLEEAGVIEKVNAATGWVSPLVITPKKGTDDIRMCVDMVQANKAIKRVRHVIPTVEELRHEMNGMTVFSKLDLTMASINLSWMRKVGISLRFHPIKAWPGIAD